ncbi:MAG: C-terminal binding protein [Planctomycetes bacterium]|nr:C-terminal binding protein [Planctomycetota bacterium]
MPAKVLLTDYAWDDLSIETAILDEIGASIVLPRDTSEAALAETAADCDAIMNNWARVTAKVIDAAPRCRIIARLGIGLDSIDVTRATERGIPVTNVPDYCLIEVAEHALALILACGRKVGWYHLETKQGRYDLKSGPVLRRMEGQTLGIIGLGAIGRKLAEKATALGLRVLAFNRTQRPPQLGVSYVELNELLTQSDYISLHVPLTSQTRHMIGAPQLAKMKPTAYLINTSRGGLIDHTALAAALVSGQLAGAALDVQDPEPPDLSQAPYSDPRVIVTPHAAFVSSESLLDLRQRSSRQIADRLSGRIPPHVVNPEVL